MKIVVFGLTISSSWGNGHATLWRGLCKALAQAGHRVSFFERDVSYYAGSRDAHEVPDGRLILYASWQDVRDDARREVTGADVAMVTSFCPDGVTAAELIHTAAAGLRVFYDLDTPVTLATLACNGEVPYIGARGLADFDLVLSYTGGAALDALRDRLGARRVEPLYGHVDPALHRPAPPIDRYRADLSYLGTFSADRQAALESLFIRPAAQRPDLRFMLAGTQYPQDFPWSPNIYFVRHLPPCEHQAFFSSSRLTLNVTRHTMAAMGWCPAGRLFEAAACGTAIVSDDWAGLEDFFSPGEEILVVRTDADVLAALALDDAVLRRMAQLARERTLAEHTSAHRAAQLVQAFDRARAGAPAGEPVMENG